MAISRQKKAEILTSLEESVKKAGVILFVNFHGLGTAATRELRRALRKVGAEYLVAKKTLLKRALAKANISADEASLKGEVAVVFGNEDLVAPAKTIAGFIKANPQMTILGGVLEKAYINAQSANSLAKLPSREVLLGQLVGMFNSPMRGLVGALSGPARGLVSVLSQIKK
jgi:large subunit ribosomal protein L10